MSSYFDGLKGAVRDAVCFVSDKIDRAATFTFGTSPGSIRGPVCNDPTPPPPIPPPFTGGQCHGVSYEVTAKPIICGTDGVIDESQSPVTRTITGRILGGGTSLGIGRQPCPGGTNNRGVWFEPSPGAPPAYFSYGSSGAAFTFIGMDIVSIVRTDGQPDDCGDPPPPPPPPIPIQPINFTYTNNEGDDITIMGDVNIGIPILIAPFTIVAPITITAGSIEFNGSVNLSPNFDVTIAPSFGDGGGGGGGGGGDFEPTEPIPPDDEDPEDDGPDEPSACEDIPIKGLVVTLQFSEDMRATELIQDGSIPAIAVPRVAILYFIARMGNREIYMAGIDLKSRQQYVPVPFNSLVTCWRIHLEPGVSVSSIRPVFDIPHS